MAWQELQVTPTPLYFSPPWQAAHVTSRWAPVRGNLVLAWSNVVVRRQFSSLWQVLQAVPKLPLWGSMAR